MNKELLEKELAPFLSPSAKQEVKTIAAENVMGLTGTEEGRGFLVDSEILLQGIVSLTEDPRTDIQEMAFKALINLAVTEKNSWNILNLKKYGTKCLDWLEIVLDPKYKHADTVCQLLSNLTREEKCATFVSKQILNSQEVGMDKIVLVLCNVAYNDDANLHYLGPLLSNLSQIKAVRDKIVDKEQCIIQRLLPFTEFKQSSIRRAGVVGTLKNCCFDTEHHDWLLGEEVDLLPRLLLPLAGPEEFDDDDMERLPEDLQYLPPDKQRESEPHIRKMICEALLQLCATKKGKKYVKEKNAYVIMREYFSWERKKETLNEIPAMNLIDILIGDEPTDEFSDNLKEVDIPDDVQKRFFEDDKKEWEYAEKEKLEKEQENKMETT